MEKKAQRFVRNHYGYTVDKKAKGVSTLDDVAVEVFNPHNEAVILIPKPKAPLESLEEQLKWAARERVSIVWCKPDGFAFLPLGAGNYTAYFRCGAHPVTLVINAGKKIGIGWRGTPDERKSARTQIGHQCHRG